MPTIVAEPRVALIDELVRIQIKCLAPKQKVTVIASLVGEKGCEFESFAQYVADDIGWLDLCKDSSVKGTFVGVEPMGLFWSLRPSARNKRKNGRLSKQDVCKPYVVTLSVFDSFTDIEGTRNLTPLATTTVERWYKAEGVKRIPVREGSIRGTLFIPDGKGPFPAVIDLFGTAGGLMEFRGALLASRGIVALSLAYFDFEDLPDTAFDIDLEYFEEAKNYLQKQRFVSKRGIGVIGVSTGGCIALAAASYVPGITCAVVINGVLFSYYTSMHYKGRTWKALSMDMNKMYVKNGGVVLGECWGLDDESTIEDSMYEFHKSSSSFLFLISEDDKAIDNKLMADLIPRTAGSSPKCRYRVITYEGAGHLLEPPHTPHAPVTFTKLINMPQSWGGNAKQHAAAQEHSWQEIIRFFYKELMPTSNLLSVSCLGYWAKISSFLCIFLLHQISSIESRRIKKS